MEYNPHQPQARLAWHETLDMHELVAFQANGLMTLKKSYRKVKQFKGADGFLPSCPSGPWGGEAKTEASAKKGDETG